MSHSVLRSRFFWKLFAGYVFLVLVATVLIGVLVEAQVEQDLRNRIAVGLRSDTFFLAQIARDQLDHGPDAELQRRVTEIAARGGARLTVMDRTGRVLADSFLDPAALRERPTNLLDRPEIQVARLRISAVEQRFSTTLGEECLFAALRVPFGGAEPDGYVRASQPAAIITARTRRLRENLLAGSAAVLIAGLVVGLMFSRRVTAPLSAMTSAVESMSRGAYGHVAVPNENDEIGRLADAFNDMSDQLRERLSTITSDRAKLLSILTSMVEGLIATDRELRVMHLNVVAGGLLGVRPDGCVGQSARKVLPHPALWELLSRARDLEHLQELREEIEVDGHVLEVRASTLRDSARAPAGVLLVLNDVTELRQLERMRQDFVVNASHELKTPLTSILGYVETLLDDEQMPPDITRRFLEKIRSHSLRQRRLVADLLSLARIESPGTERQRTALDLRGPLREALIRHLSSSDEHELALALEVPEQPVTVWANEEDLRQILDNLLGNAIKFTPAGGTVELSLGVQDGQALIEVKDTGIGLEPEDAERVFERFWRADKVRSPESGGGGLGSTGLGLAIVKHLALSLDGSASVTSELGQGSTFLVQLPLHEASA